MARRARTRSASSNTGRPAADPQIPASVTGGPEGGTTGRYLVLFREGAGAASIRNFGKAAGVAMASASDFKEGAPELSKLASDEGVVFPDLGVAVVNTPPEQIQSVAAAADSDILAIEPERIVYAFDDLPAWSAAALQPAAVATGVPIDYFRGYRDAVNHLYDKLAGTAGELAAEGATPLVSETEFTWGLQATKVPASRFTGKGIRVAVLDTGFDLGHPDFAGRRVTSQSFVQGQAVQDGNGHGTHCIGTACGPKRPGTLPRYGVAFESDIFAGKVLSNQGSGGDAGILAGIQWAVTNRCAIVSMSLGAGVMPGQSFSQVFEQAASRALAAGTLIIAAAGNDSRRPQTLKPVSHPANCPSIMAVAAIDSAFRTAFFSNQGINPQGGQIDIAGPGVDVRSSWPRPNLYNTISGTSMATPHVAGIAALWAQSNAAFRGRSLMSVLTQSARRLNLSARDVGAGLVQAP
ncbi:MAG TPA: S8 family serine peptidase [Xanthobacteraceae bacterium]|nr:S8 family serine peptidase [Xanthobacteraceae bacterium]